MGDWEMDTFTGKDGKGIIVTLVERKSSFMLMEKLNMGKQAVLQAHTVVNLLKELPVPIRTITIDNGLDFAAHKIIAREVGTIVYFTHPYCSWGKGAIENMNGLISNIYPRKQILGEYQKKYIKERLWKN